MKTKTWRQPSHSKFLCKWNWLNKAIESSSISQYQFKNKPKKKCESRFQICWKDVNRTSGTVKYPNYTYQISGKSKNKNFCIQYNFYQEWGDTSMECIHYAPESSFWKKFKVSNEAISPPTPTQKIQYSKVWKFEKSYENISKSWCWISHYFSNSWKFQTLELKNKSNWKVSSCW